MYASPKQTLHEPLLTVEEQRASAGRTRIVIPREEPSPITARAQKGASVSSSVFSVLNVYVGLGLLSKPYAFEQGGWISLPALAILCVVANVTGKLIVRSFAKLPKEDQSYVRLGEKAFGAAGAWAVRIVIALELFGAEIVLLIFVWKNALLLAPWYMPDAAISESSVALIMTLVATPTVWALDFGSLGPISLIGVVASVLIVFVTVGVAVTYFTKATLSGAELPPFELQPVGSGLPMAVGIFILSLGGHAALPGVYSAMATPERFDRMLDISMMCMFAIYASVGMAGYVAYGWLEQEEVDVLITANMAHDGRGLVPLQLPGHYWRHTAGVGRTMSLESTIMTLAVVAKSFTAISPVLAVLADLPEQLLLGDGYGLSPAALEVRKQRQIALRTLLLWVAAALAYLCSVYGGLALVEAVTGALCSMLASLGLPCAFWAALHRHEAPAAHVAAAAALAIVAACAGAAMSALDIVKFLEHSK
tara:strand:+ start:144 stop:1580 length:1437 start_codon:yes stop_codon:yes gene_type:complete